MEIKESYKERLSESGDNSPLIVMIRANWMTLEFSNALARPSACTQVQCFCELYDLLLRHFVLQIALSCMRKMCARKGVRHRMRGAIKVAGTNTGV